MADFGNSKSSEVSLSNTLKALDTTVTLDALMFGGDYFYGNNTVESQAHSNLWGHKGTASSTPGTLGWVPDRSKRVEAILGDHDLGQISHTSGHLSIPSSRRQSARYTSSDGIKVDLIGIDTNYSGTASEWTSQLAWFVTQIDNAIANGVKAIFCYHQMVTYTDGGTAGGKLRSDIRPQLERAAANGIKAFDFSGDKHVCQVFALRSGVRNVVAGAGAAVRHSIGTSTDNTYSSVYNNDAAHSFLRLSVSVKGVTSRIIYTGAGTATGKAAGDVLYKVTDNFTGQTGEVGTDSGGVVEPPPPVDVEAYQEIDISRKLVGHYWSGSAAAQQARMDFLEMNSEYSIERVFMQWNSPLPSKAGVALAAGRDVMLSINNCGTLTGSGDANNPIVFWSQIIDGSQDAYINGILNDYNALPRLNSEQRKYVVLKHEPEDDVAGSGGTNTKSGTGVEYRKMQRKFRNMVDAVAPNLIMGIIGTDWQFTAQDPHLFWPDSKYDNGTLNNGVYQNGYVPHSSNKKYSRFVGVDPYNWAFGGRVNSDGTPRKEKYIEFQEATQATVTFARNNKGPLAIMPVFICEIGAVEAPAVGGANEAYWNGISGYRADGTYYTGVTVTGANQLPRNEWRAKWLRNGYAWIADIPEIIGTMYFDTRKWILTNKNWNDPVGVPAPTGTLLTPETVAEYRGLSKLSAFMPSNVVTTTRRTRPQNIRITSIISIPPPDITTLLLVSFPTPVSNLVTGASQQSFRVRVRKKGTGTDPTCSIELWESGVNKGTVLSGTAVSSTTGTTLTANWNAASLSSVGGAGVELRLFGAGSAGGVIEVGAVAWDAKTIS
jgi:hypothetical protein